MEKVERKLGETQRQTEGNNGRHRRRYFDRCYLISIILPLTMMTTGCETVRDATYSGTGAAAGAGVATVMSGGVIAPMAGALVGASTGIVLADLTEGNAESEVVTAVKKESFFGLLEKIIEVAGWWLLLGAIAPILFGWMMPSPVQFKNGNGNGAH
ncbi:MAG: hypothetical protein VW333_03425 [Pseudomonadales bacterium]